ncbi:histidyl-tRNA synthetase [Bacillus sp. AG102]|nr:histidyl-tRNA synthetase [Bacillus sp. AG102]
MLFSKDIYEIGEEIVSGGRYDELIGNFGETLPAVGLAVQVNQIVKALQEQQEPYERNQIDIVIHYELNRLAEAERLRNLLRKDGKNAWLSLFSNLSDTFQFARKNKIGTVVEAKNEYLVEYVWNEKWVVQKEGETSCVTFKLR